MLDWLNSVLAILCPPLSPIPIDVHLEYANYARRGSPPSSADLLQLSSVRSLTITDYYGYTNCLVEALSTPTDLGGGSHRCLWPNLQGVTITAFNGSPMILLHMVKIRTEAALLQKESGALGEIATLSRFEVEGGALTAEEFEAFRAILGEAAVMKLYQWWEK
ncbi:hypothetical protein FRB95_004804 [Tulasnella sp. JGI-2019a]|nr:hypothetical protein FRB95_004804 [Tulasnella sp. JGI-2019a]